MRGFFLPAHIQACSSLQEALCRQHTVARTQPPRRFSPPLIGRLASEHTNRDHAVWFFLYILVVRLVYVLFFAYFMVAISIYIVTDISYYVYQLPGPAGLLTFIFCLI